MYRGFWLLWTIPRLAECVLPHVENLAKGCGTEDVIPVSVTKRTKG